MIISTVVDLAELPKKEHSFDSGLTYTFPDMHGNTIKLVNTLIRIGVFTQITKQQYQILVETYNYLDKQTHKICESIDGSSGVCMMNFGFASKRKIEKYLQQFNEIIQQVNVNNNVSVRMLGDMLADRGSNDALTLMVLDRLHTERVNYEIIFSNHDMDFLINLQNIGSDRIEPDTLPGYTDDQYCGRSFIGLSYSVKVGALNKQEVINTIENAYLPYLKLASYFHSFDELNIFTHAPNSLDNITALYNYIASQTGGGSAKRIKTQWTAMQQISALNTMFNGIKSNTDRFIRFLKKEHAKRTPFCNFVWVRIFTLTNTEPNKEQNHLSDSVTMVFGHDFGNSGHLIGKVEKRLNVGLICIDDMLGKAGIDRKIGKIYKTKLPFEL